MELLGLSS
jgi:hypothetical protein